MLDFNQEWKKNNIGWKDDLTPPRDGVDQIVQHLRFKHINQYLRIGVVDERMRALGQSEVNLLAAVAELNVAIQKSIVKTPTVVYRGLNLNSFAEFKDMNIVAGQSHKELGLISSTLSLQVAESIAKSHGDAGHIRLVYKIYVPSDSNAVFVGGSLSTIDPEESRLIFPSDGELLDQIVRTLSLRRHVRASGTGRAPTSNL